MGTIQYWTSLRTANSCFMLEMPFFGDIDPNKAAADICEYLKDGGTVKEVTDVMIHVDTSTSEKWEDTTFRGACEDLESARRVVLLWAAGLDLTALSVFLLEDFRIPRRLLRLREEVSGIERELENA